jgi:hypothetical protein
MEIAVDGERAVSFLPIFELNRSMRKSKQYEQTRRPLSSKQYHLRAARFADPHPSDHDLDKEDCHVHTSSVSARNLLSAEGVDISYRTDKTQQVRQPRISLNVVKSINSGNLLQGRPSCPHSRQNICDSLALRRWKTCITSVNMR